MLILVPLYFTSLHKKINTNIASIFYQMRGKFAGEFKITE